MSRRSLIMTYLLLISGVLFLAPSFVLTESIGGNSEEIEILNQKIAEKRDKIKQLEASIEEYKKKIAQKRLEAVSLSNQLAILDNHLAQVELDIEVITNKLDTINLEIETLDFNIADKEKTITKQQVIIAELIRAIHQNEDRSYLEIFAAYDSFSDFYNRLQYLRTVEQDLGKSARALKIAKEELENKKRQKEEHKTAYEKLDEELENKKKDLEEQTAHKSTLLAQTHASELTFKTLLAVQKNQYQQIENEIVGIEQEVRRKLDQEKLNNQTEEDVAGLFSWPTQSRYITAIFHDPDYPYRRVFEHNGIDIRASHGTLIKAAASGYIARAKKCARASCYSFVMIVHSGGLSTVYGHLSSIVAAEDQFITRGDVLGYSGGTPGTVGAGPFVTGPHLHFEVRKDGIPVNPIEYLVKDY